MAESRGLARFRTEQLHYSILNRGAETEILPVCQRHGLGVLVWSPLSMGLLSGRYRTETASPGRLHWAPKHLTDERKLDAVEALTPLADQAGIPLRHLALAFVTAHPAVSSAIIGPRTEEQLADLLAGAGTAVGDDLLDRIDVAYVPPQLARPHLRRRRSTATGEAGTSCGTPPG